MVSKQANGYVKCPQHGKPLWGRCAKGGVPPQHSQQAAGRLGMSFMTDEDARALQGCPCPAEAHSWRGPKQSSRVQTYTISSHMAFRCCLIPFFKKGPPAPLGKRIPARCRMLGHQVFWRT